MSHVACPRCRTVVTMPPRGEPVCPNCGFGAPGRSPAAAPTAAPGAVTPYGPPGAVYGPPAPTRTSGLAVASMVVGMVAALFLCMVAFLPFVPLVPALAAVVMGSVALAQTSKDPTLGGRGMAVAGLVIGIVVSAVSLLVLLVIVIFWF